MKKKGYISNSFVTWAKRRNIPVTYKTVVLVPYYDGYKNVLTQDMINEENIKYVIKHDYWLNGETITVPENSILEFDGGTLHDGTIIGQNTFINDIGGLGLEKLFAEDIIREGTWRTNGGGSFEQVQSDWNQSDSTKPDFIKHKPKLANVATSGNYNDLSNKPTIPEEVTVDAALSKTSTNPVQNKVIAEALEDAVIPDKPYNPEAHSGLGRKTLKLGKNGSNVLTQEDFDTENTIYVIKYDFDLNGETVEIPENCVLEFDGGSLSNGTVILNSTLLLPNPFDINKCMHAVTVQGTQKTITSAGGYTGIREDKFEKGQLIVEPGFDNWQKKVYYFDGYQLASIPTLPKISTSPSGRENTLNLCNNWVHYKDNNPSAKNFVYGGNNTCFRQNFNEDNDWEINCSTFSLLILLGIPFEKSRYYLGASANNQFDGNHYANNELMDWFASFDYNSSRDLAVYLYNQGFCFTPNDDFSNIDTGDILFFNLNDSNDREGIDFLGIDHSGIFGYKFGDRFVTFEVGSGAPEQMLRATGSMGAIVLCARLPKKNFEINYDNLIYNGNEPKTVTIDNQITPVNIYKTAETLKAGTSYTAIVDCTIPDGAWPSIAKVVKNTQGEYVLDKYLANFTNVRNYKPDDNKYYMTFTVLEDTKYIGLYANSTVSVNVSLRSTIILKGVITDISKIKLPYFPKKLSITANDGIVISEFRTSYSGDNIIIAGDFTGLSLNSNAFITVFKITPLYFIQTSSFGYGVIGGDNIAKLVQCQVIRSSNYGVLRFACNDVVESNEKIYFSISIPSR